jgi:hypothetical protein
MRYIILLSLLAIACSPQQKLQRAKNRLSDNPLEAARFCSSFFPGRDSVVYRDTIKLDTLYVGLLQVDTLWREDTVVITKTSPGKIITQTKIQYKEVVKTDPAKTEEQRQLYLACEERYQKLYLKWEQSEKQRKDWRTRFWWVLFVALGAVIGYFTKQPFWAALAKQLGKKLSNDKS